jgi:hypothetical protein
LVAHRQLAFSSLDLLDLKAAFGQAHVERRSRAILAAVLERIAEIAEFILSWFAANGLKAVRQDVEVEQPQRLYSETLYKVSLTLGKGAHISANQI